MLSLAAHLYILGEEIDESADARRKMLVPDIDGAKSFDITGVEVFQHRNEQSRVLLD